MKRCSKLCIFFLLFLVVAGVSTTIFLVYSGVGAKQVVSWVNRVGGNQLQIDHVSGNLGNALSLTDVHGELDGFRYTVEKIEWSWQPLKLFMARLHVGQFKVSGVKLLLKEESSPPDVSNVETDNVVLDLPAVPLPLSYALDGFILENFSLIDTDGESLLEMKHGAIRLEGNGIHLGVRQFDFDGPDLGVKLHGVIQFNRDWYLEMLGSFHVAGYGFFPSRGTLSASGPIQSLKVGVGVTNPASIRVEGRLKNLIGAPEWVATLDAERVELEKFIVHCPDIFLHTVRGNLHGTFSTYIGHVAARGDWGTMDDLHLETDIDGYDLGIRFDTLRIDRKDGSGVGLNSSINWKDLFGWDGDFVFTRFDLSGLHENLTGLVNARFSSRGEVLEEGLIASFKDLQTDGTFYGHRFTGKGALRLTENGIGSENLLLEGVDFGGRAQVESGWFSWEDVLRWEAAVTVTQFNPEGLVEGLKGNISGALESSGDILDEGVRGRVILSGLGGELLERPLSGGGSVSIENTTLQSNGLEIVSGSSRMFVEGKLGEKNEVHLQLNSPDISELIPDGSGKVQAVVNIDGDWEAPQISAKLLGEKLEIGPSRLGHVDGNISGVYLPKGEIEGELLVEDLSHNGLILEKGSLKLDGVLEQHTLELMLENGSGLVDLNFAGGYNSQWQGKLTKADLDTRDFGSWQANSSPVLAIGQAGLSLGELCLQGEDGRLCGGGTVQFDPLLWDGSFSLEGYSVDSVDDYLPADLDIEGKVSATASFYGDDRQILHLNGDMGWEQGVVTVEVGDVEPLTLEIKENHLHLENDASGLAVKLDTASSLGGMLSLNGRIEGFGPFDRTFEQLGVSGNLNLRDIELNFVAPFVNPWVEPEGTLSSRLQLSGSLGHPTLTGDVELNEGKLFIPRLGTSLSEITGELEAHGEAVSLRVKAVAGPGTVAGEGDVQISEDGVSGNFSLQGKNCLLIDLPEYLFRVSPDIRFAFSPFQAEVRGAVSVDYGRIQVEELKDTVSVSEDVVVVNGDAVDLKDVWPLELDVRVTAGEDVRVKGYGLDGRLTGEITVQQLPGKFPTGDGELALADSTFTFYGRSLDISKGRLIFSGGPVENPGLDVRAEKTVSDEEARGQGYTVGVDVSGLVSDLKYNLFSVPYKDESEILSLLVVGHSFTGNSDDGSLLQAAAEGIGLKGGNALFSSIGKVLQLDELHLEGSSQEEDIALVVGKRIAENLYIGYDVNMFNQVGQFRVRYDLDRGFWVETRSSSEATGADLLYSFEK